jgi:hypothetical protein
MGDMNTVVQFSAASVQPLGVKTIILYTQAALGNLLETFQEVERKSENRRQGRWIE